MSGIKRYIAWCEDEGHTNEVGEVVSMEYADEYMKSREYAKQIKEQAFKEALADAEADSLFGMMREMNNTLKEYDKLNGTNFSK
tara:strand:+ start:127 stop:378 length:252 start_codon:yes stop_codon:yes gene_type:complete